MDNVFEKAVSDFFSNRFKGSLLIHNTYGLPDEMPLEVYFRGEEDLSDLESYALDLCNGSVLDVGAGLGALTLIQQKKGIRVDALEISSVFSEIMMQRGVKSVINENFLTRKPTKQFDTLLMMMNGFGLCGTIAQLPNLFEAIHRHLGLNGQVIFDSSDISYLYDSDKPVDPYYGEMSYQYEYAGDLGSWFKWLYIDAESLGAEAERNGFDLQVLYTEETGQYLGRLTRK